MRTSITYFKYLYYLIHCGSLKKITNYIFNKIEKKTKKIYLESLPINIIIDPCTICNLHCPGCAVGVKYPGLIESSMLNFEQFKYIFDQIKEYVFNISLYCFGEPFLNKEIFRMIKYASVNRCGTTIHSNFNIFDEEMAEKAISSRLTHLYLSIDGATQEIYEIYRKNGDLSKVFGNIRVLVDMKKKMKSMFPIITWKYLIFPFNAHEIKPAKKKAKELGVNSIEFFFGNLSNVATYGLVKRFNLTTGKIDTLLANSCSALWDSLFINPDGSVLPCCQAFRKVDIFGNIYDNSIRNVWNNDNFLKARKIIATGKVDAGIRYPCRECEIVKKLRMPEKAYG